MQKQQCLFCGSIVELVHVHGHYQCPACNTNALPCCDGDNCSTNNLLQQKDNEERIGLAGESQLSINNPPAGEADIQ